MGNYLPISLSSTPSACGTLHSDCFPSIKIYLYEQSRSLESLVLHSAMNSASLLAAAGFLPAAGSAMITITSLQDGLVPFRFLHCMANSQLKDTVYYINLLPRKPLHYRFSETGVYFLPVCFLYHF